MQHYMFCSMPFWERHTQVLERLTQVQGLRKQACCWLPREEEEVFTRTLLGASGRPRGSMRPLPECNCFDFMIRPSSDTSPHKDVG